MEDNTEMQAGKGSAIVSIYRKVPLILQICIGLLLGIILALVIPGDQVVVPLFGQMFIGALKGIAPILVFVLISSSIARRAKGQQTNIRPILFLYIIDMLLAAALAFAMSLIFPSTFSDLGAHAAEGAAPKSISQVLVSFITSAVDNPIHALANANYISILFWSVLAGIMFGAAGHETKIVLKDLADCVSGIVRIVIRFAPLGVMGLVFSACTKDGGFGNLLNYVHVLVVLVATMLLVAFVVNAIIVAIVTRKNPYPLIWTCVAESGLTAFFTRSSAANVPVNMELCKKLKLPESTYSISIPLGCTINMAGAAVTIIVMTMAAVATKGIQIDLFSGFVVCVVSVLAACGTSGVAGGSLMLIPLACSIFGIDNDTAMEVVGIGFIIGVLQDSSETALNSSTDVLLTAAACERQKRLGQEKAK